MCVSPKYAFRSGLGCSEGSGAGAAAGSATEPEAGCAGAGAGAGASAVFLAVSSATDFAGADGSGSFFWQAPSVTSAMIAKVVA